MTKKDTKNSKKLQNRNIQEMNFVIIILELKIWQSLVQKIDM